MRANDLADLVASLTAAGLDDSVARGIARYGAVLLAANERTNLTGARSTHELLPHLLDSLTLLPYVQNPLIDIGSGAGLPAIPVALATSFGVTLVESRAKRARFLAETIADLCINGHVVVERAESAARQTALRDAFACGTARAVGAATVTAELVLPFIAPGGLAVLQRGRLDSAERSSLQDAALVLGAELETIVAIGEARSLCLIRKTEPTPTRFPRRPGIPEKRPLCA